MSDEAAEALQCVVEFHLGGYHLVRNLQAVFRDASVDRRQDDDAEHRALLEARGGHTDLRLEDVVAQDQLYPVGIDAELRADLLPRHVNVPVRMQREL
eukprot:CAMPEP_0204018428 /NCGR_PEP_ID=MMETSP0360-20130528/28084_1 /ASSEMBLY_ACC=CAM_ASM_000342 /TAXON_ID=268821 /ORGANISM="Scrippsiella Hangoei, Strain SHTV-5" /LENGTH=97 /DNA_ID=CAMNT_0050961561 /DNA_START=264 /DNA_END=558 /DNA_ORIENTATION=-